MDMLKVKIDTVDSFQGSEKFVILLSTVRANGQKEVGFAKDPNRLNVAVTRARKALIVFGNTDTLSGDRLWRLLIDFIKLQGKLITENSLDFAPYEYPPITISIERYACVTLKLNRKINKKIGMVIVKSEGMRGNDLTSRIE